MASDCNRTPSRLRFVPSRRGFGIARLERLKHPPRRLPGRPRSIALGGGAAGPWKRCSEKRLSGGVGRLIDGRRSPVFAMRTAQAGRVEPRALLTRRRREYGYDAPKQGLLPMGSCATLFAFLAAIHKRSGRTLLARV